MRFGYEPLKTPIDRYTGKPRVQVVYGQPQLVAQADGLYPTPQSGLQDGGCGATPNLAYARYAWTPPVEPLPMVNSYPYPKQTGQGWTNLAPGIAFPTNPGRGYRTAYDAVTRNVGFLGPVNTY